MRKFHPGAGGRDAAGPGGPGGEHFGGLRPILCANLPYNITTPLLTRVVESRCFDSVTVLIQKEVAQRICAAPGTADYGAFSLLMQYYTAPELVFEVPNTCFLPAPKVTSAVIHCPARREPPVQVCSEAMLWRTVRAGFALRRKTLVNSLQTGFPLPKRPAGGHRHRLRPAGKRPG
ncbi:MAG: ribosomal RNA small subunit methyltransferase A [Oscillospiraceae bacterium]